LKAIWCGVDFARDSLIPDDLSDLAPQLFNRLRASAGDCLVTGGKNSADAEGLVQRIKRHQSDGSRTIRIGNDAFVQLHIGRVNFRDDERHVRVHAESAGVINHDTTGLGGDRTELFGNAAAGAEQSDVDPFERVFGQLLNRQLDALEWHGLASGAGGGEQCEFANGKFALLERLDHFHANSASRAHNCNMRSPIHKKGLKYKGFRRGVNVRTLGKPAAKVE
jgi:hypothetical protein